MTNPEREPLLSMAEAAEYLNLSWETLRKRRQTWGIRAYIVGGHPKFRRDDLDEWLEKRAA